MVENKTQIAQAPSTSKEKKQTKQSFNELTPREWALLSKSVLPAKEVSSQRKWYHIEHGATFSNALASRFIRMYSKPGDLILDPFLGIGTTLFATNSLSRRGIGIEIYRKFSAIAKDILKNETTPTKYKQTVITGDCRNLLRWVKPNTVQLVFTSPPYSDFIRRSVNDRKKTHKKSKLVIENKSAVKPYGDDERDFCNLKYEKFLTEIKLNMKKL